MLVEIEGHRVPHFKARVSSKVKPRQLTVWKNTVYSRKKWSKKTLVKYQFL